LKRVTGDANGRACVKNPWIRFVLVVVLDFTGDFEDENEDENEEEGAFWCDSHRLGRARHSVRAACLPRRARRSGD
jgi:hypothetical protein